MDDNFIFSIGYGARNKDEFLCLLQNYQIKYVVDVRSRPYSKFKPEFSKAELKYFLKEADIQYVFMGDLLGGQPNDPECYINGKVDYSICKTKDFFQEGLRRLCTAKEKQIKIALMCSEGKPQDCHRCKLIGEALSEKGVQVSHIDENGILKKHQDVMLLLTNGQLPLLDGGNFTSRKKYTIPINGFAYDSF